jgi:hypothetical protein
MSAIRAVFPADLIYLNNDHQNEEADTFVSWLRSGLDQHESTLTMTQFAKLYYSMCTKWFENYVQSRLGNGTWKLKDHFNHYKITENDIIYRTIDLFYNSIEQYKALKHDEGECLDICKVGTDETENTDGMNDSTAVVTSTNLKRTHELISENDPPVTEEIHSCVEPQQKRAKLDKDTIIEEQGDFDNQIPDIPSKSFFQTIRDSLSNLF